MAQAVGELHINSDFNFDHADKDVFASDTFFSASTISLLSGDVPLFSAFSNIARLFEAYLGNL